MKEYWVVRSISWWEQTQYARDALNDITEHLRFAYRFSNQGFAQIHRRFFERTTRESWEVISSDQLLIEEILKS